MFISGVVVYRTCQWERELGISWRMLVNALDLCPYTIMHFLKGAVLWVGVLLFTHSENWVAWVMVLGPRKFCQREKWVIANHAHLHVVRVRHMLHKSCVCIQTSEPRLGKTPTRKYLSFTCCQVEGHWGNPSQSKGLWGSLVTHHSSDLPQRAEGSLQLIKLISPTHYLISFRVLPFSFIYMQAHCWICLIQRTEKQPSNSSTRKPIFYQATIWTIPMMAFLWVRYCPSRWGYDFSSSIWL